MLGITRTGPLSAFRINYISRELKYAGDAILSSQMLNAISVWRFAYLRASDV